MRPDALIMQIAGRLRMRAAMRIKAGVIVNCLYWGAVITVGYVVLARHLPQIPLAVWIISIPLLIALLIGIIRASAVQPDVYRLMVQVDREFELQERLTTAYELLSEKSKNPFTELQVKDAAEYAEGLNLTNHQIDPALGWRFRYTLLLAAFTAVLIIPATYKIDEYGLNSRVPSGEDMVQLGTRMERPGVGASAKLLPPLQDRQHTSAENIPKIHEVGAASSLKKVGGADTIRGQNRMINSLIHDPGKGTWGLKDLEDDGINQLALGFIDGQLLEQAQTDQLKDALESRDTAAIKELLERFLNRSKILTPGVGNEMAQSDDSMSGPLSSNRPNREGKQANNAEEFNAGSGTRYKSVLEALFEEVSEGEEADELKAGRLPGKERGSEIGGNSPFASNRTQDMSRIKGRISKGEELRGMVKALPLSNPSNAPPEEVIVKYRHRAESLMDRFELPLHYREYIKQYFNSIGLIEGGEGK